MAGPTLFSEIWGLVGKRADHPDVIAFHTTHKLGLPPAVMRTSPTATDQYLDIHERMTALNKHR